MKKKYKLITLILIFTLLCSGCSSGNNTTGINPVEYTERNLEGQGSTGIIIGNSSDSEISVGATSTPTVSANAPSDSAMSDAASVKQSIPEVPELTYTPQAVNFKKKDLNADFNRDECISIFFTDEMISVSENGDKQPGVVTDDSTGTLLISGAGDYLLSGDCSEGCIYIAADQNDDVRLILDGLTLSNSLISPIYAESCDKLIITLAENSVNTISDIMPAASDNDTASEDSVSGKELTAESPTGFAISDSELISQPPQKKTESSDSGSLPDISFLLSAATSCDSTVFSKSTISINGSGSLFINSQNCQGIHSTDSVKLISGNIEISSGSHGIKGKDAVIINSPEIKLISGGDGIKSTNTDENKGFVSILGGNLKIDAVQDGISAENCIEILGGKQEIICNGGAVNGDNRSGYGFSGNSFSDWWKASNQEETTYSAKGLKANSFIFINGGDTTVDSSDDALHSNNSILMEDGNLTISSGDDGIHADSSFSINDGKITIKKSYEGIESASICINGGDSVIYADDDGLNAASGSNTDTTNDTGKFGPDSQNSFNPRNGLDDGNPTPPEGFDKNGNGDFNPRDGLADGSLTPPEGFDKNGNGDFTPWDGLDGGNPTPPEGFDKNGNGDFNPRDGFGGGNLTPPDGSDVGDFGRHSKSPGQDTTNSPDSDGRPSLPGDRGNNRRDRFGGGMAGPFAADSSTLFITGGSVYINSGGDGIDSNGNIYMTGGTVMVDGPVNNGNSAFDHNGTALISGGTIVASGSSGMIENFSSDSPQNVLLVYFGKTLEAGRIISLTNSDGSDVLSFTNAKSTECAIISTPALKEGSSYTLSIDDEKAFDITVTGTLSHN